MKKNLFIALILIIGLMISFGYKQKQEAYSVYELREIYSQPDASKWPKPHLDSLINKDEFEDIGLLGEVEYPENNPYSKEKKQLGKLLFFDGRLSASGQIACASCHNPELAWTDNVTRSFGDKRQTGKRNAMTIKHVAFAESLFWDGRSPSLEEQAKMPIKDPKEMNTSHQVSVANIAEIEGYKPLFKDAFGDEEVSLDRITKAIATFERSLASGKSKFDRFISGNKDLFTDQEVRGLHLFRTKARCINCHNTPYFSDNKFHNDGQTLFGSKNEDLGRFNFTKDMDDLGKFKTPTLREVGETGPWMHHGHFPSLLDVVQYYNLGNPAPIQKKYTGTPRDSLIPPPSPLLQELELTESEVEDVIAFLNTLSTRTIRMGASKLPE